MEKIVQLVQNNFQFSLVWGLHESSSRFSVSQLTKGRCIGANAWESRLQKDFVVGSCFVSFVFRFFRVSFLLLSERERDTLFARTIEQRSFSLSGTRLKVTFRTKNFSNSFKAEKCTKFSYF